MSQSDATSIDLNELESAVLEEREQELPQTKSVQEHQQLIKDTEHTEDANVFHIAAITNKQASFPSAGGAGCAPLPEQRSFGHFEVRGVVAQIQKKGTDVQVRVGIDDITIDQKVFAVICDELQIGDTVSFRKLIKFEGCLRATRNSKLEYSEEKKRTVKRMAKEEEKKHDKGLVATFNRTGYISNTFLVYLREQVKVYTLEGCSRIFFQDGEGMQYRGNCDTQEYFRKYVLQQLRQANTALSLENYKGLQFYPQFNPSSYEIDGKLVFALKFTYSPFQQVKTYDDICVFLYQKQKYKGVATRILAKKQEILVKGEKTTVYDYFKTKGITLREQETLVKVVHSNKRESYFPVSLCKQAAELSKGEKDQTVRHTKLLQGVKIFEENLCNIDLEYFEPEVVELKCIVPEKIKTQYTYALFAEESVITDKMCHKFENAEMLVDLIRRHGQRINVVIIKTPDRKVYLALKRRLAMENIITQFILEKKAQDPNIFNAALANANAKTMCTKYLKKEKLAIGIDVNQHEGASTFGVSMRLHGKRHMVWSWAEKFGKNQEMLPPETINLIFERIWNKYEQVMGPQVCSVLLIRDFPGKGVFEKELKTIRETKLFKNASNFHCFTANKSSAICTKKQEPCKVFYPKSAAFYSNELFTLSSKDGIRPLLYQYHVGKGAQLTKQECAVIIQEETVLHTYKDVSKFVSVHKNSDEAAYLAAVTDVNISSCVLLY